MKLTLLLCGNLEERQVNKGERHLQNHFSLFFFWVGGGGRLGFKTLG